MARRTKAEKNQEALETETALNTNRDGVLIRPGQMWKDMNPRSGNRIISVSSVSAGIATVFDGNRTPTLAVSRMYPHSRGYKLWGAK
ncbi:hypothetical protein [Arthrobacter sp. H14]|uniref:hypothetical protein n=1 Tax=Arthrobacter sp. H14 TaxID=1312959 RepID=UPI00047AB203|nr:hypothetical protein [Arthrobacter sp. H14]